jgi:hypothetical protein
MVVETTALRMKRPFDEDGFDRMISSIAAA